jgi:prepilin-type processing-associated H-X9-DG protein
MAQVLRRTLLPVSVLGLAVGLLALGPTAGRDRLAAAPRAVNPLDRVPGDAGLFAHLQASDLWNHPAVAELRKAYAKELEPALKSLEKATGLRPEDVNSITFHFPKLPQGPGDEALFVLQVTTKKPYNRDTVVAGFRAKGGTSKEGTVKLKEGMVLEFTTGTQFTVLHQTLLEEFKKGPPKAADGVMSEAIKAARAGKSALVVGLDPSQLPAEILTGAESEPRVRPFVPLLKSKAIVLQANLDKELSAEVRFLSENEDKAVEAERSFNLLMKLADEGLATVLKTEKPTDDLKPLLPALTELQKVVQGIKAERRGTETTARAALKADPAMARPIVAALLRPTIASARAQSQNNLKQIGLAMHNYADIGGGVLPAAAIVDKRGKPLLSWRVAILPYVEQNNLYKQFHLDEPWDSEHNKKLIGTMPKVYALPYGGSKPGQTHYRVFVGQGAAFDMVQGLRLPADFPDGTSNTMLAFEAAEGVPWTKPDEIEFDPQMPMVKHLRFENSICNVLMADGSVRAVPKTIREEVLKLVIQRNDGQPIPDF